MTQETSIQETAKNMENLEGKYLTFRLADEEYGVEILKVQEIIGMMNITGVPQTSMYIRGVINLRGKVIPVIDLRLKFGMEAVDDTEHTCIIVLEIHDHRVGIIVDEVCEVLDILSKNIEPAPPLGNDISQDFILGMGKIGDKVKILLDLEKVLGEYFGAVSLLESEEMIPDEEMVAG
jgi:purine-binding chemotaxis protein CheW